MKNTYNRYIWLLNTLLVYKKLTFEEIKSKWDDSYLKDNKPLNLRTFHDHRNAVEQIFNVTISCDAADGYRYFIEDDVKLQQDTATKWLLNSFNTIGLVNEGQNMHDRILLEQAPSGTEYLSMVIKALKQNLELEIEYQAFYDEDVATYHIRPYCMKLCRRCWYVAGYLYESKAIRHLALDRIKSLKITDVHFDYPTDFSPEEYYKNSVGIYVNDSDEPQEVVLRAFGKRAKMLRVAPLHYSQCEIAMKEKYSDFRYNLCLTHELVLDLVGMGSTVEVLQPKDLRKSMKDEVKAMWLKYRNDLNSNDFVKKNV